MTIEAKIACKRVLTSFPDCMHMGMTLPYDHSIHAQALFPSLNLFCLHHLRFCFARIRQLQPLPSR